MMFRCEFRIGSAASTSIGGVMVPMSAREGYDRGCGRGEYRLRRREC